MQCMASHVRPGAATAAAESDFSTMKKTSIFIAAAAESRRRRGPMAPLEHTFFCRERFFSLVLPRVQKTLLMNADEKDWQTACRAA